LVCEVRDGTGDVREVRESVAMVVRLVAFGMLVILNH
jgi:hypothetical protein